MTQIALNAQFIKKAICPDGKKKVDFFDTQCKGLLLEVRSTKGMTFYLRYTDLRGKSRQIKLGDIRDISLAQARQLADKYRNQIAMGIDPMATKKAVKDIPKFSVFINESYLPFVDTYKRSADTDRCLIKNHLMPAFGKMHLDEITKKDVIQLIHKHRATHMPGSTNRIIILLRYIFNCAIRWETPGVSKNPTAGIPLLEENNRRERYLTVEEANRLIEALKKSDNKMLQYIIPMLLLTGARRNEVMKAKWLDFNLEQRLWRIPTSKSGKARYVPISDGVLILLDSLPRWTDCEWVFPNPKTKLPYVSFYSSWNTARKSVDLSDVRIHDLRHAFASFLINNGRSLYEVQRILGHTQQRTTQRYAHLSKESLISAANEITKALPILAAVPKQVIDIPLIQIST
ncbi:tyrosine-type recombinase/integrase [Flavobacterium sp.]|jgi:integrase|uniref:tyrosine-type recombinase/integrase n=1 Tax=Flavobacterium sp. TaxID=239 RepID=UPI0037C17DC2